PTRVAPGRPWVYASVRRLPRRGGWGRAGPSGGLFFFLAFAARLVGADALDERGELFAFGIVEPFGGFGDDAFGGLAQVVEQRLRGGGQVEQPRAAVGRVGAALDQPGLGQPVDHPRQGDRLDLDQFGERPLP